jgi:hypothetical protein
MKLVYILEIVREVAVLSYFTTCSPSLAFILQTFFKLNFFIVIHNIGIVQINGVPCIHFVMFKPGSAYLSP